LLCCTCTRHACSSAQTGHWRGPVTGLGRLGPSQPVLVGPDPVQKKLSLGLGPSCLNPLYFSPFYFDIWLKKSPYLISNIRKFQKKLWILLNLFIGSSYFFRIFHCIFDLWIFTVKCKFGIWYIFFSFFLFKIKNKKICMLCFRFILRFIHWRQSQEYHTFCFCYIIFNNAKVWNIHTRIFIGVKVRNIIGKPSNIKTQQTLSNLRQNQRCSVPQVERLRGDNIFSFA